jgi:4-carboxymuconolactone decarboxylase
LTDRDDAAFAAGLKIRRDMFGPAGAEQRLQSATELTRAFEEVVTRYCFGETWTRPGLDLKTRSLLTIAVLTALGKPNQLKAHVTGALANGATQEQIREVILHTVAYAGIPAGVEAFTAAGEVLARVNAAASGA